MLYQGPHAIPGPHAVPGPIPGTGALAGRPIVGTNLLPAGSPAATGLNSVTTLPGGLTSQSLLKVSVDVDPAAYYLCIGTVLLLVW